MKNSNYSKINGMKTIAAALAVVALQSGVAMADTATAASATASAQSTATASPSAFDQFKEKAILNYYGYYTGGAINDPGNSFQPNYDGTTDYSSVQRIENLVNVGARLNKDTNFYVGIHSFYYMRGHGDEEGQKTDNTQSIDMLDPIFVLSRANVINTGGFKLKVNANAIPALTTGTGEYAKKNHQLGAVSLIGNATYDLPASRFTLGLYSYVRGYVPGPDTADNARTYRIVVAPNANYQMTETLAATLWVDAIDTRRYGGTGFISGMTQVAPWDIEPGINWDITPSISFNPILNLYPSNLTLNSTSIQAILTAKAF